MVRKIVVPLVGGKSDAGALSMALSLARGLEAHVDAVFLRPDPADALPYVGEGVSAAVIEDIFQASKSAADSAHNTAERAVRTAAAAADFPMVTVPAPAANPSVRFVEETGSVARTAGRASRLADLVVFPELKDTTVGLAAFEAALIGAGRPVVIAAKAIADRGPKGPLPSKIMIAWNGSGEAARAVMASVPLLVKAKAVDVVTADALPVDSATVEELAAYLELHGIAPHLRTVDVKGRSVGVVLLETAATLGTELVVMGGYGHSRLREFILGGVTRHILANATIPVLMAH